MTEPEPDRREQILEAALDVFAQVGYHKATIKQIAKRARLKSPALIYWYFENKAELLKATLKQLAPFIEQTADPELFITQPPEQVLTMLAVTFVTVSMEQRSRKLMRVFLSEAIHSPEMVEHIVQGGPIIVINSLSRYFAAQIEQGTLRPHDPQASARQFMGMLLIYLLSNELMTPLKDGFPPGEEYARQVVALFLDGMRA